MHAPSGGSLRHILAPAPSQRECSPEPACQVDDLFARLTKEQAKSHVLRLRGRELKVLS